MLILILINWHLVLANSNSNLLENLLILIVILISFYRARYA